MSMDELCIMETCTLLSRNAQYNSSGVAVAIIIIHKRWVEQIAPLSSISDANTHTHTV